MVFFIGNCVLNRCFFFSPFFSVYVLHFFFFFNFNSFRTDTHSLELCVLDCWRFVLQYNQIESQHILFCVVHSTRTHAGPVKHQYTKRKKKHRFICCWWFCLYNLVWYFAFSTRNPYCVCIVNIETHKQASFDERIFFL